MSDERMLSGYSGHTHDRGHDATDVMEVDGVPVVVSVAAEATLWTCDLRGGDCVSRPLDLASAEPDDAWYFENEHWDEDDDDEEFGRPRLVFHPYNITAHATVTHLDNRPVLVTGGERYDFSFPDDNDSSGGIVRAWDTGTGRLIGKIMAGHGLAVTSLTTVPSDRGTLAVSTCEEGTTLTWDLASGNRVSEIEGSYNGVMGAATIDGTPIVATGGHDDFVQVWDIVDGTPIADRLTGLNNAAWTIAVTAINGRAAVLASDDDGAIHVWDLATRQSLGSPLTGHASRIFNLETATVAGRAIAVTSDEDGVDTRVWDLDRGEQVGDPIPGHELVTVTDIAGTPTAVTKSSGDGIRLWDLTRR